MLNPLFQSESWICLNCRTVGPLSKHGRCETCDSDAVAVADTGRASARNEFMEAGQGRLAAESSGLPLRLAGPILEEPGRTRPERWCTLRPRPRPRGTRRELKRFSSL